MSYESLTGPFIPQTVGNGHAHTAFSSASSSPPYARFPSSGRQHEEELINAFEAEEERILNTLSRKLEQLRQDKINLERIHEEESESHVNRLARELAGLRIRQQQQTPQPSGSQTQSQTASTNGSTTLMSGVYPDPSPSIILDALKKENETLRSRLADMDREQGHLKRVNEIYREELIEHRARLGLPVDHLVGLSSGADREPLSQPTHMRRPSTTQQQSVSCMPNGRPSVPIPRASNSHATSIQPRRTHVHEAQPSLSSVPSASPSTSSSPSPRISPLNTGAPASYITTITSPPSSASLHASPPAPYDYYRDGGTPAARVLSYPSVPPPSLSSSLGSPVVATHMFNDAVDGRSTSRRSSGSAYGHNWGYNANTSTSNAIPSGERRVVESGSLRDLRDNGQRGGRSMERGGRVAETGTLARSRAGSGSSVIGSGVVGADLGVFVPSLDETLE